MKRLAIAPLTRSGFTSFFALQLFEVAVTADFLNNPQPNSGIAHRSRTGGATLWVDAPSMPARENVFLKTLSAELGLQMLPVVTRVAAGE